MVFNTKEKKWVFVLFVISLLAIILYMFKSYVTALFAGALISYLLHPLYQKIEKKLKSRLASQIILSFGTILLIIGFFFLFIVPLVDQTQTLYDDYDRYLTFGINKACLNQDSLYCTVFEQAVVFTEEPEFKEKGKSLVETMISYLFKGIQDFVGGLISFTISLVIMVFSIFYFLDHGEEIKNRIVSVLPIQQNAKSKIYKRLKETIDAVVSGNITVALMQGVAGSFIFGVLGIPLALFFGLIIFILAFIPAIGPALIWLPTVVILFLEGSLIKASILLVYSIIIFGYLDTILKPKLIGNKMKLSSFVIFLGVLGGLKVFGFFGVFIGPIVIALFVTSIGIYQKMK
jgi:predicted PurR-regulated permease PerM